MKADGRVNARLLIFVALLLFVVGALFVYTLRQRPPIIPADRDHHTALWPAQCLSCHGPGEQDARGPNHPLNDRCFDCHERP